MQTTDTPTCKIKKNSEMGKVLLESHIIIWDEVTTADKKSLEVLDYTVKDLRENAQFLGGALILLFDDL